MNRRVTTVLAAAFLFLAPAASHAALAPYSQNFEAMVQSNPNALSADGWVIYGNVFSPDHSTFLYGYGTFPAPNNGFGFSTVDAGQGGVPQGVQQLNIFSDYNNVDHGNGNQIESNVFREQTITAADVGKQWTFQFDAKLGNLVTPSTALAFIKTLDPANSYATTNFLTVNTTALPATWGTFTIPIAITAPLVGQILQIGFANTATHYVASGVYYDNVIWFKSGALGVPTGQQNSLALRAASPNPFTTSTRIEYSIAQSGPAELAVYDIGGRKVTSLFKGVAEAGPHAALWNGRDASGARAATGVYFSVLQTASGRESKRIVLDR